MKLMIVEDEAIAALFLRSTLDRLGYTVTSVVDNGEQAVQHALEEQPDVVLMDIRLRGDMDGVEAANRIREATGITSIFISAYAKKEVSKRYRFPDEFRLIAKPVMESELIAALQSVRAG